MNFVYNEYEEERIYNGIAYKLQLRKYDNLIIKADNFSFNG